MVHFLEALCCSAFQDKFFAMAIQRRHDLIVFCGNPKLS